MKPKRPLTRREVEVLAHLTHGKSQKQTAADLRISIKTVQTISNTAYKKMGVSCVIDALRFLIQNGYIKHENWSNYKDLKVKRG